MPLSVTSTVNERSSCKLEFQLVDFDGVGISSADVLSATMKLINKEGGETINSRTGFNAKPCFTTAGHFSMLLDSSDNVIVSEDYPDHEEHIATFEMKIDSAGGDLYLKESISVQVVNLRYIS
jgi:hypothetical protein